MIDVKEFDRAILSLSPTEVIQKYITFGSVFIFPIEEVYFSLKKAIASEFDLHPTEVLVVGSAKLGFSIAPNKYGRPFGDHSDIDVAIISPQLYDRFWKLMLGYALSEGRWERRKQFCEYLLSGWIRPDYFPYRGLLPEADHWWDFFRGLTVSRRYGPYKISAGLYREIYFLELYQTSCIQNRKKQLEVQTNAS